MDVSGYPLREDQYSITYDGKYKGKIKITDWDVRPIKKGDKINIECDIIGKYVEKLLGLKKSESKITKEFLFENGFF